MLERCYHGINLILDVVGIRVLPDTPYFRSYDEAGALSKVMTLTLNCLSAAHSAPLAPKH